jgi:hypothetical protein
MATQYTFLPWYRTGLATAVEGTEHGRGYLNVALGFRDNGVEATTSARRINLLGPGDILGIDQRAIVRLDPRDGTNDFEPNYMAAIEFFDEDYPWRYSPKAPEGPNGSRLTPWLALVVLQPAEFDRAAQPEGLPRAIVVKNASVLPRASELWAWAHTHLNTILPGTPGETAAALERDPAIGCSRLVAPRRLKPNTPYHAFLVPVFEAGRRVGLPDDGSVAGTAEFAWADAGAVKLPFYYEWTFGTADRGDFEQLVQRLLPWKADPQLGRRPMDMSAPLADALDVPPIRDDSDPPKPILQLEGALQVPGATPSGWDASSRTAFQSWLAGFVNLADAWKIDIDGSGALDLEGDDALPNEVPLPIVLPPSYGRWHAAVEMLDPAQAGSRWLEQINLDPRNRVAAAFGTLVAQTHQEAFMARAWQQYGELFRANSLRARAQIFREMLAAVHERHYAALKATDVLAMTSAAHTRVLVDGRGSHTAWSVIRESALPRTLVASASRRVLRPDGPIVRRFGGSEARLHAIVPGLATRRLETAPAWAPPPDRISLAQRPANPVGEDGGWLGGDWDQWRRRLVAYLEETRVLAARYPTLRDVIARVEALLAEGDAHATISVLQYTPEALQLVTERPLDWTPGLLQNDVVALRPEDREPSRDTPGFSFLAANFRQAALNAAEWLTMPVPAILDRSALDLNRTAQQVYASLTPAYTVIELIDGAFAVPEAVPPPRYDPLDQIMAHPVFDDATCDLLRGLSIDYVVPNLSRLPNNSVTLLEVNWRFVESFLVGLNHEMARELLWRGYPTDRRGSYFRQFWDVDGIPGARHADGTIKEEYRDIHPIHGWKLTPPGGVTALTPLGGNRPDGRAAMANLVLVVRGDVMRRYPNVDVYAAQAVDNPAPRPDEFRHVSRKPFEHRVSPGFRAQLGPDTFCYGFNLDYAAAKGSVAAHSGWYFVLAERFGEPRFGLDEPAFATQPPGPADPVFTNPPQQVRDANWAHLVRNYQEYEALDVIALDRHQMRMPSQQALPLGNGSVARWTDSDAGQLAAILLQVPVRVFFHGNDMLPSQ